MTPTDTGAPDDVPEPTRDAPAIPWGRVLSLLCFLAGIALLALLVAAFAAGLAGGR